MTAPLNWQGKGRTLQQRIFDGCIPEPNSGCWLWVGGVNACGYGTIGWKYKSHLAHRVSYVAFVGKFNKKKKVLHQCDTPCCVNPDHLFIGSQRDNVIDMETKGRSRHLAGSAHGRALLTEEQVLQIRATIPERGYVARLASQFGVATHVIKYARKSGTWKTA